MSISELIKEIKQLELEKNGEKATKDEIITRALERYRDDLISLGGMENIDCESEDDESE